MQTKDFYALSPSLKTKDAVECESFVNKLLSYFLGPPGPRNVIYIENSYSWLRPWSDNYSRYHLLYGQIIYSVTQK